MDANEDNDQKTEANEETNDPRVAPRVLSTTPLQGKKQADDTGDEHARAEDVELLDALEEGHVEGIVGVAVDMKEEEDDAHGNTTDWEVNVEAFELSAD